MQTWKQPPSGSTWFANPNRTTSSFFIKDRWIAARTLFGQTVGEDARTPDQLAADYRLPLEAVLEAIAYCESDPMEIREDWQREQSVFDANGMNGPPPLPPSVSMDFRETASSE